MSRSYDVVIIGAGHNGLTTAAYLAGAGYSVAMFERRSDVGGCCVTEEIDPAAAPGCRVSTTSYIASMLRPEVIRDLRLAEHGLRMQPCEPGVVAVTPDHQYVAWWSDPERLRQGLQAFSASDAVRFVQVQDQLHRLARYLQPFFLEAPPDIHASGLAGWMEALRVGKRFRGLRGDDMAALIRLLTGSLGDFLDREFEHDAVKALILANSLYGKHGGPYQPGTAVGLLFHLLGGGEADQQGYMGHVIGGMGAITQAMAAECRARGVTIQTRAAINKVLVEAGAAVGVELADGEKVRARVVVSNADPKRTFLKLLEADHIPADFRKAVSEIRMAGPSAKVNFVLDAEPQVRAFADANLSRSERALFTLVPSLRDAEICYDQAKVGKLPDRLWVDCVLASNVDDSLCPEGRHVLTCFVQFVPYELAEGDWESRRDELANQVEAIIERYAPGFRESVVARRAWTPWDLEQTFGITEGNIFHGDISLEQLFFMRPVTGFAHYRSPVDGMYLCGAGTHPGGGVTGAPGYNAARAIMQDVTA